MTLHFSKWGLYGILYDDGDREDFVTGKLIIPQRMDGEECKTQQISSNVVCGFAQPQQHKYVEAPEPRALRVGERVFSRWTSAALFYPGTIIWARGPNSTFWLPRWLRAHVSNSGTAHTPAQFAHERQFAL